MPRCWTVLVCLVLHLAYVVSLPTRTPEQNGRRTASIPAVGPSLLPIPSLTTCQPVNITWTGGTPPYIFWAMPNYLPGVTGVNSERFSDIYQQWFLWTADLQYEQLSGISFKVTDGQFQDSPVLNETVQDGANESCLNAGGYTSEIGVQELRSVDSSDNRRGAVNTITHLHCERPQ